MVIYIILPASMLLCGAAFCRNQNGKRVFCTAFALILFFLSAIRYNTGADYMRYYDLFSALPEMNTAQLSVHTMEKGFLMSASILADHLRPEQIFTVIAFIFAAAVGIYIYRNSTLVYVSFFAFTAFGFWFFSMNYIRQFMAAVIIMYSMKYIAEQRFFRFIVFAAFAAVFHLSAIFIIPFYFIFSHEMNRLTLAIYLVFSVFCFIFSDYIIQLVTNYVYSAYDPQTNPDVINGQSPVYAAVFAVFFTVAFAMKKILYARSKYNAVLLNCLFFGALFQAVGVKHAVIARMGLYFLLPAVTVLSGEIVWILIQLAKLTLRDKTPHVVYSVCAWLCAVMLAFSGGFYAYLLSGNYCGVLPYKTVYGEEHAARNTEGYKTESRNG